MLLNCLALETLVLVMDGSGIGRGCCVLMIHVIDKGRALPLAWVVRQCPKGRLSRSPSHRAGGSGERYDSEGNPGRVLRRWRV